MINIILWKWRPHATFRGEAYEMTHANIMINMIERNLDAEHRIVLVTDDPFGADSETFPLWEDHNKLNNASGAHLPSCYRRLRIFDPATQLSMGIERGERICSIDLDAVVINKLDKLLVRKEKFIGWGVRGTYHPRVFNGSMFMFNAGDFSDIWKDFDPARSPRMALASGFMGSDQGWLSYKLARRTDCAGWCWPEVASYPRETFRIRRLDVNNKIIFFHGRNKPWQPATIVQSPWIKRYYKKEQINDGAELRIA